MKWLMFVLLSAVTNSLYVICNRIAVKDTESSTSIAIGCIATAVFLIAFGWACRFPKHDLQTCLLNKTALLWVIFSGIIMGVSWIFYVHALKHGPMTKVAITDQISLLFTVLLSTYLLGECIQLKQIIGTLLIALGAYLVAVAG